MVEGDEVAPGILSTAVNNSAPEIVVAIVNGCPALALSKTKYSDNLL